MYVEREKLKQLVFPETGGIRFTQDSPVMPDVWFAYGRRPKASLDLLLEPRRGVAPAALASALRTELQSAAAKARAGARVAYDERFVVAQLDLRTLVRQALPLSGWWKTHAGRLGDLSAAEIRSAVAGDGVDGVTAHGAWLLRLLGALDWVGRQKGKGACRTLPTPARYTPGLARLLKDAGEASAGEDARLWSVNRNREAGIAIWSSSKTIKADAATRLFSLRCGHLKWAVLDTGIDARHPAFRRRAPKTDELLQGAHPAAESRVVATYDFTRIRRFLDEDAADLPADLGSTGKKRAAELRKRLRAGQTIDWDLIDDLLLVDHGDYRPPGHPHGTHVAGILGADWRIDDPDYDAHSEHDMKGICPDIQLYDLRVLRDDGTGDEFSILAALQFVRYLNARARRPMIQGVNLSLAIPHDVSNFACGRTPVCQEVERLHSSGVVVVAAAGNKGYVHYVTTSGPTEAYQNISITDPGNSQPVLTVGATHRGSPHTYGVSYFSSRGPTGDGRLKPDLVAPGEKIKGPVPDSGTQSMDGTSMAAPHVSGAAALIMSRHPEFVGDPARIKRVLCDTATDLGRERYFQGAGLVDVCRALQSI